MASSIICLALRGVCRAPPSPAPPPPGPTRLNNKYPPRPSAPSAPSPSPSASLSPSASPPSFTSSMLNESYPSDGSWNSCWMSSLTSARPRLPPGSGTCSSPPCPCTSPFPPDPDRDWCSSSWCCCWCWSPRSHARRRDRTSSASSDSALLRNSRVRCWLASASRSASSRASRTEVGM